MTVELCNGPGTATWTSSRYTATVNGSACYVWQWAQTVVTTLSTLTATGETQSDSICKWGADATATVDITLIDGTDPVTTYELLPNYDDVTASIVSGKLRLVVPAGRKFMALINGERTKPLHLICNALQEAVPSGSVAWATWLAANPGVNVFASGTKIHFPAGEWDIGDYKLVGTDCRFHFDKDAMVQGRYYVGESTGSRWIGNGFINGLYALPAAMAGLPYEQFVTYSIWTNYGGTYSATTNEVVGPTVIAVPAGINAGGISNYDHFSHIAYFQGGIGDGIGTSPSTDGSLTATVSNSYVVAGDDALHAANYNGKLTVTNSVFMTVENACCNLGYWDAPPTPDTAPTFDGCHWVHLGIADTDTDTYPRQGLQSVFRGWMDGDDARSLLGWGRDGVTWDGTTPNRIYGPLLGRIFTIGNLKYPFTGGVQDDAAGNQTNFTMNGLIVDEEPGQPSLLFGRDADNTPHDLTFTDVVVNGVTWTADNFRDYVTVNSYPYNITVNGRIVAMALTVEDGTGLEAADSYVTTGYTSTYLANTGRDTEWAAATTTVKETTLRRATAWIDQVYCDRFKGYKSTSTQALEWPRSLAYDLQGAAIEGVPTKLKEAVAEVAYRLVTDSTALDSDIAAGGNVASESVTVGAVTSSTSYSGAKANERRFPVVDRLLNLGSLIEGGQGWATR